MTVIADSALISEAEELMAAERMTASNNPISP